MKDGVLEHDGYLTTRQFCHICGDFALMGVSRKDDLEHHDFFCGRCFDTALGEGEEGNLHTPTEEEIKKHYEILENGERKSFTKEELLTIKKRYDIR